MILPRVSSPVDAGRRDGHKQLSGDVQVVVRLKVVHYGEQAASSGLQWSSGLQCRVRALCTLSVKRTMDLFSSVASYVSIAAPRRCRSRRSSG